MPDGSERRLDAIQAATDRSRWKLLTHAATIGPFGAGEAAKIAGLPVGSGNARSTHAEGLCRVKLLERELGRSVSYRATTEGFALYRDLVAVVDKGSRQDPLARSLLRGQHVDLVAEVGRAGRKRRERVTFRISRET